MERKQLAVKVNTVNESDRTIDFIISDESLDRDEDVILTSAWDFSEFQKNPQFLGFHNYQDFPLGKPIAWGVDDRAKKTWMRVKFPSLEELATIPEAASEKAKLVDTVYNMYRIKMLNAVSVGFSADEVEPHKKQIEGRIPRGRVVKRCKLLEVSAVPVPANPNAVSMVKSFSGDSFEYVAKSVFEENKTEVVEKEKGMEFEELTKKVAELEAEIKTLKEPDTKANRRLSKASMAMIEACNGHMEKAMGCIKDLISSGVVETEDNDISSGVEKNATENIEKKSIDLAAMTVEEANEYISKIAETSKE